MMRFTEEEIISTTDITKNFAQCRDKTKEIDRTIIFKNNKPDLVLLDFDFYKKLQELADTLEDIDITRMIEERRERDNGKRLSLAEVREKYTHR